MSGTSWIISKGQMVPLDCAWNFLAQGKLSDAVLHCNRAERKCSSLAEWVPPWNSDREACRYLSLSSGLAEDKELPFLCCCLGQHPCQRGSFYLSLWLPWNSNPQQPQPALQSRYVSVVWAILLLSWKLRFHPSLSQAWPPGCAQPSRAGKWAEATVNNSLLI